MFMKGKLGTFFKVNNFVSNLNLKRETGQFQQWINDGDKINTLPMVCLDTLFRLVPHPPHLAIHPGHAAHPCQALLCIRHNPGTRVPQTGSLPSPPRAPGQQGPSMKWGDISSIGSRGAPLQVTRLFRIRQTR